MEEFIQKSRNQFLSRFEVVITAKECTFLEKIATGETIMEQTWLFQKFHAIVRRLLQCNILLISTGNWWANERCQFMDDVHNFFQKIWSDNHIEKPMSLQHLYTVYHLEQILYYATFGAYNSYCDLKNKKWLLKPTMTNHFHEATKIWPKISLPHDSNTTNCDSWYDSLVPN